MNAKQFMSSTLLHGVDFGVSKFPIIGKFVAIPLRIMFPTMGYEKINSSFMRLPLFISIYLVGFIICFGLQAYLADKAGYLGTPDLIFGATKAKDGLDRVLFLDDAHNIFNYVILVPLYLVAGTGYMVSLFSLRERMVPVCGELDFHLNDSVKPYLSGTVAVGAFSFLVVILHAGYAFDIHEKSIHLFWFHGETTLSRYSYNGYIYLSVNMLLTAFVALIALLHLELFRWSYILSHSVREMGNDEALAERLFKDNGNRLKELFSPFTETAIWSKAFAMLLAINIFTWKESGVSGGVVNCQDIAVKITKDIGISNGAQCEEIVVKAIANDKTIYGSAIDCPSIAFNSLQKCGVDISAESMKEVISNATTSSVDDNSIFFRLTFVLFLVIVLWAVSLPRYRIQLEIFKLRQKQGVHEYFDIRMPWTIGWSTFIDFMLLTFFTTAIFGGSDYLNLTATLFDG